MCKHLQKKTENGIKKGENTRNIPNIHTKYTN